MRSHTLLAILLLGTASFGLAREPAARIRNDLRGRGSFVLPGSRPPQVEADLDLGEVDPNAPVGELALHFRLAPAQQADLDALVRRQVDRTSSDFHKWLTPEQFASRYGLASSDLDRVRHWLESNGLTVTGVARSRMSVSFTGPAAFVENAFGSPLHRYSIGGRQHRANQFDISLPAGLNGIASAVSGLDDFAPQPRQHLTALPRPNTTTGSGAHYVSPDDLTTIYNIKPLHSAGFDGSRQKIVIAGQTAIDLEPVRAFRRAFQMPANDPQFILAGSDPGVKVEEQDEAYLDLEWAGAAAPNATLLYVYSTSAFNSALYAIDNNLAPVISLSYGLCEANVSAASLNFLTSAFQQANAQGITVIAASGDRGAATCDSAVASATRGLSVDVPANLPSVTGVGGTSFQEAGATYWAATNNSKYGSATSYIPEAAWNETAARQQIVASGGGASKAVPKPTWQTGLNVPNDGARHVPDVALLGAPQYLFCGAGTCTNGIVDASGYIRVVGGTSVSAPVFAGIVSLIVDRAGRLGNMNPGLYSLAALSANAFHDVTAGDNIVPCTAGTPDCDATGRLGYTAGAGYDQVTGLGSVDAYQLFSQWGSGFNLTATPTSLTVNAGRSATAQVQVVSVAGFAGPVRLSCSLTSSLVNTTCSIPETVTGGGTATLTVTNQSAAQVAAPIDGRWEWPLAFGCLIVAVLLQPRRRAVCASGSFALLLCLAACDDGGAQSSAAVERQRTAITGTVRVTGVAGNGIENHEVTLPVTIP